MRCLLVCGLALAACHPGKAAPVDEARPFAGRVEGVEQLFGGARAGDALPLVFALHGLGGSPENISQVFEGMRVPLRVIALRGIVPWRSGHGWFQPRWSEGLDAEAPGIMRAADAVAARIAEEVRAHPPCGAPIVLGFSQGGMISYALALRDPPIVAAALPIAGLLPPTLYPRQGPKSGASTKIYSFHGAADATVSVSHDREANERFRAAGHTAELREYPDVKHAISPQMQREIDDRLEQLIREAGCAR